MCQTYLFRLAVVAVARWEGGRDEGLSIVLCNTGHMRRVRLSHKSLQCLLIWAKMEKAPTEQREGTAVNIVSPPPNEGLPLRTSRGAGRARKHALLSLKEGKECSQNCATSTQKNKNQRDYKEWTSNVARPERAPHAGYKVSTQRLALHSVSC